jgi:hypothetical protein
MSSQNHAHDRMLAKQNCQTTRIPLRKYGLRLTQGVSICHDTSDLDRAKHKIPEQENSWIYASHTTKLIKIQTLS